VPLTERSASRLQAINIVPNRFAYLAIAATIAPMLLGTITKAAPLWRRIEGVGEFSFVGAALAFNICNLLIVTYQLVENPSTLEPVHLFYTSIGVWSGNVLIFTLIYWLIDSDGPDARLSGKVRYPDFDFPAMDDPERVPPGWRPKNRRLSVFSLYDFDRVPARPRRCRSHRLPSCSSSFKAAFRWSLHATTRPRCASGSAAARA
jgi:hypothetical protein